MSEENDSYIDVTTGDAFKYIRERKEWKAYLNVGIYSRFFFFQIYLILY